MIESFYLSSRDEIESYAKEEDETGFERASEIMKEAKSSVKAADKL